MFKDAFKNNAIHCFKIVRVTTFVLLPSQKMNSFVF